MQWHGRAEALWNSCLPNDTDQCPETRSAKEAQGLRDQLDDAKRRVQQAELAKASILAQVPILFDIVATAVHGLAGLPTTVQILLYFIGLHAYESMKLPRLPANLGALPCVPWNSAINPPYAFCGLSPGYCKQAG